MHYLTRPAWRVGGLPLARTLGALLIVAVLLASGQTALANRDSATSYASPQFEYEIRWRAPWEIVPMMTMSEEGSYDTVAIFGSGASMRLFFLFADSPTVVINEWIEASSDGRDDVEVTGRENGNDELGLPYVAVTLAYDTTDDDGDIVHLIEYIEAGRVFANDGNVGVRVVNLWAAAEAMPDVYEEVQTTFVANQGTTGPFFAGRPAGGNDDELGRGRGRADSRASDAAEEYLAILGAEIDALEESVDRFYALLNDPDFGDRATTAELVDILNAWIGAYQTAQSLTPPPGFDDVHTAYLVFTGYLAMAATDLFEGDPESAVANLEQALEVAAVLADLLAEATGSDLLDRRSG